jgi:ubiquinone/menaquinone biosynthesis C-methylase UbiE
MKPTEETFYEWNEEHARKHDLDKFYNHPNKLFKYIENKRIRVLIDFAEIGTDSTVLEVGCGAGHILERIDKGILYGIDISSIQIDRARERLRHKVFLKKSPGEHLPFEDKFFDRIICTKVFEHVLDPRPILQEMNRVLKDNGIISLSIPNETLINHTKTILNSIGLRSILAPKRSG